MIKVGSTVKRRVSDVPQKNEELGIVIANVTVGNIRLYEDWFWVLFGDRKYRMFKEELEEVEC